MKSSSTLNRWLLFVVTILAAMAAINEMYSSTSRSPWILLVALIMFVVSLYMLLKNENLL